MQLMIVDIELRRHAGYTTMLCPACGGVRTHAVRHFKTQKRSYMVLPVQRAKHIADETVCRDCGLVRGFKPGVLRQNAIRDKELNWTQIVEISSPEDLFEGGHHEHALAFEGTRPFDIRQYQMKSIFNDLHYMFELERRRGKAVSSTGILIVLLSIGLFASALLWFDYRDPTLSQATVYPKLVYFGTLLLLLWVTIRCFREKEFATRRLEPILAIALARHNPKPYEFENLLDRLKEDSDLAAAVSPKRLWNAISARMELADQREIPEEAQGEHNGKSDKRGKSFGMSQAPKNYKAEK